MYAHITHTTSARTRTPPPPHTHTWQRCDNEYSNSTAMIEKTIPNEMMTRTCIFTANNCYKSIEFIDCNVIT